jgi:hypothetical protein
VMSSENGQLSPAASNRRIVNQPHRCPRKISVSIRD